MRPSLRTLLQPAIAALLAACALSPAPAPMADAGSTPRSGFVEPNANLVVQGIPPIPAALADQVDRYSEFRGHAFVEWHPTRREMLVAHRPAGASTLQLYRLAGPLAEPQALTAESEAVSRGSWEPQAGRYLVYMKSRGGDEAFQLYRLDPGQKQGVLLSDPARRHAMQGWLKRRGELLSLSVPLDRTAAGGTRSVVDTQLEAIDPVHPGQARPLAQLPGTGWSVSDIRDDEQQALLIRYGSATQSEVWLLDLASLARRQLLPAPGSRARAAYRSARFSAGGHELLFSSDAEGEFRQAYAMPLAGGTARALRSTAQWDVDDIDLSRDGRWLALRVNEDGRDALQLHDAEGGRARSLPGLASLPEGTLGDTQFHPLRAEMGFALATAQGPAQIFSLDASSGQLQQWTRAVGDPRVDPSRFAPQQLVRWPSFDGREISGWLTLPPPRFTGRRPVLIDIHGGPEGQARAGFLGRRQYFVQELGLALIRPNVRGSRGYGKSFLNLDNGMKREDSVKDIGALLDWIAGQPGLDASRVVVTGGSYGGYMSLAAAVHFSPRLAGVIDIVGISNFVSFLENTESYRRDLRRAEYGDERDPVMRAFLTRISPLSQAERITRPLLVVQGRNDPRVPWTEAEQIVARVRAQGTPVWYLRAENEGHGFARKENADFEFYAMAQFLKQQLGL